MPDERPRPARWLRSEPLWLGLYLAVLLAWLLDPAHPRVAGLFHDDGVYFSLGRSLVDRGVYRDPHTPNPIQIAKYPPGEPLLAALCLLLAPEPEEALGLLRAVHALFLAGALAAFRSLLHREGGAAARCAPLLLLAAALSPPLLDYLRLPMSEIPYLALSLGTLALLAKVAQAPERPWRHALPLAALCFAAFAFRTVGATLTAAGVVSLLLARRPATAFRLLLLAGPALGLLQAYLSAQARPAPGFEDITVYGLPYGRILADGLPWLDRVVQVNTVQSLLFLLHELVPQALSWLPRLGTAGWLLLWAASLGTAGLLLLGLWAGKARPGGGPWLRPWHLHLLLSLALVIPWPFQTARFLVPLIPLLALLAVQGAEYLAGRKGALACASVLALAALLGGLPERLTQRLDRFTIEGRAWNLAPVLDLARELERSLPRERTVLASSMDPLFAVHAGLDGVWAWTITAAALDLYGHPPDLLRFHLDPERQLWLLREREAARLFGLERLLAGDPDRLGRVKAWALEAWGSLPTPAEGAERPPLLAALEEARSSVRDQFRRLGVTHAVLLLEQGQTLYEILLARLVRGLAEERKAFLVRASADGLVQTWRILP